jgi:hypothetical protein
MTDKDDPTLLRLKTLLEAELIVNVTELLPGGIKDWPANVQDRIYNALEKFEERTGVRWVIVGSKSDVDPDTGPFVHVMAVTRE